MKKFLILLMSSMILAPTAHGDENLEALEFGQKLRGGFQARYGFLGRNSMQIDLQGFSADSGKGKLKVSFEGRKDLGNCQGSYEILPGDGHQFVVQSTQLECSGLQSEKYSWIHFQMEVPENFSGESFDSNIWARWAGQDIVLDQLTVRNK